MATVFEALKDSSKIVGYALQFGDVILRERWR